MSHPVAFNENVLLCPKCQDVYVHHAGVTVNTRVNEDEPGTRVTIAGGTGSGSARAWVKDHGDPAGGSVAMRAADGDDFAGRRDDVSIAFLCEHCGWIGSLVVQQHKGCTLIEWEVV